MRLETRSLALLRAQARAPAAAVVLCAVILSAVGVRSLLTTEREPVAEPAVRSLRVDLAARWAAEVAARELVGGRESRVLADEPRGEGRLITVAVTEPRPVDVAVLVSRDAGRLVVHEPAAIVGRPATRRAPSPELGREVTDPGLRRVVGRVLGNYLRGERDDVAADLSARARVSVPAVALEPRRVDAVAWLAPGRRVAAVLSARLASGELVDLRYELGVVRTGGRWLVSQIHIDPLHQEVLP